MANSPLQGADGPVRLSITSDGTALADSISIISVKRLIDYFSITSS